MPSASVTCFPSMLRRADSKAVDTPEQIFSDQLGFAPSHIMPVRLAIMFFTAKQMRW